MPASSISQMSHYVGDRSAYAAVIAKKMAQREIALRIKNGSLNKQDRATCEREYQAIYSNEYYKCYANMLNCDRESKIIYVDNPSSKKYFSRHAIAHFSRTNHCIQVHRNRVTISRLNFPLDDDVSLDTKETFLSNWPGPLDRPNERTRRMISDYVDNLWQHDSQRRIRYVSPENDDQRKTILRLLAELLNRNGSIDAPGVTRLLLRPEHTEIQKDEFNKGALETVQKYLLLGKRSEAIKFARSNRLWDLAQCLAFLDKFQPPNSVYYFRDTVKLKDDPMIQLIDEFINYMMLYKQVKLGLVFKSLLNRILQSDPESISIVKHHDVGSDVYEFAMLSANDCEVEFDNSNEIFKLISAVKNIKANTIIANTHIISLGHSSFESNEPGDDISYRSHLSFRQADNPTSRTLIISNLDLSILNEIWEYCLNLANGTTNNYIYIVNLIPHKLVLASKLLDYGLYEMFAFYLESLETSIKKAKFEQSSERDLFYDWDTIEQSIEYLRSTWEIFRLSPGTLPRQVTMPEPPLPLPPNNYPSGADNYPPFPNPPLMETRRIYSTMNSINEPQSINPFLPISENEESSPTNEPDPVPMSRNDLPSFNSDPYPMMNANTFNQGYANPPPPQLQLKSSSPVDRRRDSNISNPSMGESFANAYSPINQNDDLFRHETEVSKLHSPFVPASQSLPQSPLSSEPPLSNHDNRAASKDIVDHARNNNDKTKSQSDIDQQSGFLSNLVGTAKSFLPKSNSKPMILPNDSDPKIFYDHEKQVWVDKEGSEVNEITDEPPPMLGAPQQPNYSFANRSSTKTRYPRA